MAGEGLRGHTPECHGQMAAKWTMELEVEESIQMRG